MKRNVKNQWGFDEFFLRDDGQKVDVHLSTEASQTYFLGKT